MAAEQEEQFYQVGIPDLVERWRKTINKYEACVEQDG
jgi:hypothetical protein